MSRALTPGLICTPRRRITRVRELPVRGALLVQEGERVVSNQIVAEAELSGDLYILRLPERMGLEVSEVLSGLRVREGDSVESGDLLCHQSGLFGLLNSEARAPESGTVEFIASKTGHLGLRLAPKRIEVDAYISGTVTAIEPGKSVTITSDACFVQGIFGVGGEQKGSLYFLDIPSHQEIRPNDVASVPPGSICVGGSAPTIEALREAARREVVGLVCGSIDDRVLSEFLGYELGIALTGDEDIPFSLIVTDGFGNLGISHRVLRALDGLSGKNASMNGKTQVRAGAVRPELIVDTDDTHVHAPRTEELILEPGADIRLLRVPYFGEFATVVELPVHEEVIPTGARARVLRARLQDGTVVTVPRANIELV
ncbi:MAG: hypothetical protein ACO3XO_00565 [Bdellovibrionota bacterium]